ncbi:hypothetical protein D3C81_1253270 [compost metagenome]
MQLSRVPAGRQRAARGVGAHRTGHLQTITILTGNQITRTDQRIKAALCFTLGDHLHGINRQGRVHQPDQRKALANELTGNVALGQRQLFTGHVVERPGAVRCHPGHQHRRAVQERAGKPQLTFTLGTQANARQHIDLAILDTRQHVRHGLHALQIELQPGALADFRQHINHDPAKLAFAIDE